MFWIRSCCFFCNVSFGMTSRFLQNSWWIWVNSLMVWNWFSSQCYIFSTHFPTIYHTCLWRVFYFDHLWEEWCHWSHDLIYIKHSWKCTQIHFRGSHKEMHLYLYVPVFICITISWWFRSDSGGSISWYALNKCTKPLVKLGKKNGCHLWTVPYPTYFPSISNILCIYSFKDERKANVHRTISHPSQI